MSATNYRKWDNIELSDDEDVEVHPNLDRESFLRWRKEAIHLKRAEKVGSSPFFFLVLAHGFVLLCVTTGS